MGCECLPQLDERRRRGGEWWGVEVLGVCVWVLCGGERVLCVRSVIKVKRA